MTDKSMNGVGQANIGLIGLGTMGAALALNIAEKGFPIAVWNRTTSVTDEFIAKHASFQPKHWPRWSRRLPRPARSS